MTHRKLITNRWPSIHVHLCILMASCVVPNLVTAQYGTEENPLEYSILEELDAGVMIGNVAIDAGIEDKYPATTLRKLTYSFLRNPPIDGVERFEINPKTGIIKATSRIDRDGVCFGDDTCTIKLGVAVGPATYFQVISVNVDILDQNDNYPEFNVEKVDLEMPENTAVGSEFDLPNAEDIDTGMFAIQRYELVDRTGHFKLEEVPAAFDDTIELKLILTKELDREMADSYRLVIYAYDGATPPLSGELMINVTVTDSNDNPPVFKNASYVVNVREDFHINETLVTVTATDSDLGLNGRVLYSFNSRTQRKYGSMFSIKPHTGDIVLRRVFDYHTESSYHLVVGASDQGDRPKVEYTTVEINVRDVNNHYPQIVVNTLTESGEAQILESVTKGTFVAHISVTDADFDDNAHVECLVNSAAFALTKLTSTQYKLITRGSFDRETKDLYQIIMSCTDSGKPPLRTVKDITVRILDENDFVPKFTKTYYVANVQENNRPGTHCVNVSATDPDEGQNANLTYYIVEPWSSKFHINPKNGEITVIRSLDHEETQQIDMIVGVRDGGDPPKSETVTVLVNVIDVNDEPPVFSQPTYSFGVFENMRPDAEVGYVFASDKDSDPFNDIEFEIIEEDVPGVFRVDRHTGQIRSLVELDRETMASYHLVFSAKNPIFPVMSSTAEVTIYVADENDNPPVLEFPNEQNDTIWISNRVPQGFVIAKLRATDRDIGARGTVVYKLLGGVEKEWFEIDSATGEVTTVQSLKHFEDEVFRLDVQVSDQGEKHVLSADGLFYIHVNSSVVFYLPERYRDGGIDPNTLALIVVLGAAGFILVVLCISVAVVKRQSAARRSHTYKCRPSESQRMLKCAPGDPNGQDAWKERPVDETPEILFKVIDSKPNIYTSDEYRVVTPSAPPPMNGKSPHDSPLHQIKARHDTSETYHDRAYDVPTGHANSSTYRPAQEGSDLYQPLVHGDQRVTQPCDPAVEELRLLEYLKHISDEEYGESEGESNPDSGRGASEEGDQGTENGKNGCPARRSPSKCGSESLKPRATNGNGMSTFMPQHSPKSGRLTPNGHGSSSSSPSPNGSMVSPASSTGNGSNGQTGPSPPNGPHQNTQAPAQPKFKKTRPVCPRPPSSTYQNLKDMAMYVDGEDDDVIDGDIDGCIPIISDTAAPCRGIAGGVGSPNGPAALVGVDTDLCYTDSMDVKHSIV